jgi:phosphoglycerol transferase MdoB-like AlkP superfamily enzyme
VSSLGRFASAAVAAGIVVALTTHRATPAALSLVGLLWASVPFALALVLTRRPQLALWLAALVCLALYFLSRVKIHYYKEPLLASDFYLAADPTNWHTLAHYPLAALPAALAVLGLAALALVFRREARIGARAVLAVLTLLALHAAAAVAVTRSAPLAAQWQASLPKGKSPYVDIVMSLQSHFVPPTPHGDGARFAPYIKKGGGAQAPTKPDIVVWLQESTFDPQFYDLDGAEPPRLRMFELDSHTHAKGPLRVQTAGGGTWLSEFALLTGLPSTDFGVAKSAVFYTVTPHLKHSLFRELRRDGYRTVVLTPFNKSAYHAASAYADLGVDVVLQPQELGYPGSPSDNLWHIASADMAGYALQVVKRYEDKPIFLFMLTMKEHGPYDSSHPVGYRLDRLADRALAGRLSDYFARLEALDAATEQFAARLFARDRPAMFLYFGDHQAVFGASLAYRTNIPRPDFATQFVLRDNLPEPARQSLPLTDISFLGGMLLERAGLPLSPFYAANVALRKACHGGMEDCANRQLVGDYQDYIYRTLQIAGR